MTPEDAPITREVRYGFRGRCSSQIKGVRGRGVNAFEVDFENNSFEFRSGLFINGSAPLIEADETTKNIFETLALGSEKTTLTSPLYVPRAIGAN